MRMPEDGPLGDTFFEASDWAMVEARLVKRPFGGWVESVVTVLTQRFLFPGDLFLDGMRPLLSGRREGGRFLARRAPSCN